jgi:hypothetical protein
MKLHIALPRPIPLALAALLLAAPAAWAGDKNHDTFKARLSGEQEVPPVVTDSTGRFKIEFNKDHTEAEMTLSVNDGEGITQAHLHCAPVGVNGPFVVYVAGLNAAGYDVDGKWISNAIATDASIVNPACGATLADLATSIQDGRVYVNVHSLAYPSGVIRGQLEPDDDH